MAQPRSAKFLVFLLVALAVVAGLAWYRLRPPELPPGFAAGNGRLEATEFDVASKVAGRLESVVPREGDPVERGAVVARLDADELEAQLRMAQAQVLQAKQAARQARLGVAKSASDSVLAEKTLQRSAELVKKGYISGDKLDRDQAGVTGYKATLAQSQARVSEADAAVAAAQARVESLKAALDDTSLTAPVSGRVLYRLMEPGEVVGAGGKVLTLLDLTDMSLSIYLPDERAGKVALHGEARIVLDALPDQPIPATVVFVAPKAQFTPREVETKSEREKLMFRVKVRADQGWLAEHAALAKSGMPGMAYVRLDPAQPWPERLQPK